VTLGGGGVHSMMSALCSLPATAAAFAAYIHLSTCLCYLSASCLSLPPLLAAFSLSAFLTFYMLLKKHALGS